MYHIGPESRLRPGKLTFHDRSIVHRRVSRSTAQVHVPASAPLSAQRTIKNLMNNLYIYRTLWKAISRDKGLLLRNPSTGSAKAGCNPCAAGTHPPGNGSSACSRCTWEQAGLRRDGGRRVRTEEKEGERWGGAGGGGGQNGFCVAARQHCPGALGYSANFNFFGKLCWM